MIVFWSLDDFGVVAVASASIVVFVQYPYQYYTLASNTLSLEEEHRVFFTAIADIHATEPRARASK